MANDALDEVERLVNESALRSKPRRVAKVKAPEEEEPVLDDDDEDLDEVESPPKKKTVRKTARTAEAEVTLSDEEVDALLPAEESSLKPEENVKTLEDMYAKYGIGTNPEFKIQVYREWPKMGPGGAKMDGYYESWDQPLSQDDILREYGGGTFRIVVQGPNKSGKPGLGQRYASFQVQLAGDPKYERKPRAASGPSVATSEAVASAQGSLPAMPLPTENPKLAEKAMQLAFETSDREREERRRAEEKAEERARRERDAIAPLVEAERRAGQVALDAVKDRADMERRMLQERLDREREEREELRRQMEESNRARPSITQELADLAKAGLLGNKDDGKHTEALMNQLMERHQRELMMIHEQHAKFVESLRQSHTTELAALRDAQRREIEAEREASRSREQRIEERLSTEREERRRDQERHREVLEERDRAWKDRLEQAVMMKEQSWESRQSSLVSTYESKTQMLDNEISRLKMELEEARRKTQEIGDPVAQMMKMRDLKTTLSDVMGISESAPAASSGGIGIGGGGEDWKAEMAGQVMERLPAIIQMFQGGQPAGQPQPQQQYHPGQVVETPNGPMVVVVDPASGQLALAPKAAVEAHQAQLQAQARGKGGGSPLLEGRPRRREPSRVAKPPAKRSVSVTPNLAEGLPKRAAPWEGGGEVPPEHRAPPSPPPPPPSQPRMQSRGPLPPATDSGPVELSAGERSALRMLAKEVHEHVSRADEPEEFVDKMMTKFGPVIRQFASSYTIDQIVSGVAQVEPGSAGATPAGRRFIYEAFRELQQRLRE